MQKVADLHVHTHLSDGTFSPEKVVEYAKAEGLYAIAITDHDSCKAITPAIMEAKDLDMEIVPGVELTAELEDEEIHILGYFIDWQNEEFVKKLEEMSRAREERARGILKLLRAQGIKIEENELFDESLSCCSIGRLHIANLLYKKGVVFSLRDAFTKYLGNDKPCYVKKFKLSPREAVEMIKGVGGVSVLAHPKTIKFKDRSTDDAVGMMVDEGIQGIEVYHSDHSKKDVKEFNRIAEKYNLLISGGSDCHGMGKSEVLLGKVKIPYELVDKLRAASRLV